MFYDRYCGLCQNKGVSPSRAAIEMGISKGTVSVWKNKGTYPQAAQLNKIADYFGVSTDYLLGKEEGHEPAVTVYDEDDHVVHLDEETLELIDSLRSRPEMKMMFSVTKKATREDILRAVKIIEALRNESEAQ